MIPKAQHLFLAEGPGRAAKLQKSDGRLAREAGQPAIRAARYSEPPKNQSWVSIGLLGLGLSHGLAATMNVGIAALADNLNKIAAELTLEHLSETCHKWTPPFPLTWVRVFL